MDPKFGGGLTLIISEMSSISDEFEGQGLFELYKER